MSLLSLSHAQPPQSRSSSPEKDSRRRRSWKQRIELFALRHETLLLAILHFAGIFLLVALGSILLARRILYMSVGDTGNIADLTNAETTADPTPWPSFEPLSSFEPMEGAHMVTGVILNWKRFDNVKRIVDHLCEHSMFQEIIIWNNNPDMFLKHSDFPENTRKRCRKLLIYNSPKNLRFVARYLGCLMGTGTYCYFQDDDWLVPQMKAFYANFLRSPNLIHTFTNEYVYALTSWKWSFFRDDVDLHTCFSWVGTGAFATKDLVREFIQFTSAVELDSTEFHYADMYFTTFMNQPPYQLESDLNELPQDHAFSGETNGIARNKYHIHKAVKYLYRHLQQDANTPFPRLEVMPTLAMRDARSPCVQDDCLFLTNKLSFPDVRMFQYAPTIDVDTSERIHHHYDDTLTFLRHPYHGAVDGSLYTNIQSGDYFGLDLLRSLPVPLTLELQMDATADLFLHQNMIVEISNDGETYISLQPEPSFRCNFVRNTKHHQEKTQESKLHRNREGDALNSTTMDGKPILLGNYARSFPLSYHLQHCLLDIDLRHHRSLAHRRHGKQLHLGEGYRFIRMRITKPEGFPYPFWIYEFDYRESKRL